MGPILLAIAVIMANCAAEAAPAPAPSEACDDSRNTACIPFILASESKPSSSCCSNLTYIVTYQPECICRLFSLASDPAVSSYKPRTLTLFGNCSLSSDYNSCSNSSSGPSPAPTSEFDDSTTSRGRIIGISVAVIGAVAFVCLITFFCWRRRRQLLAAKQAEYEDLKSIENKPNIFTYNELKAATKGFHQQNKLGKGGFGAVYKGVLPDGALVAVKKLSSNSDKQEFINEVSVISSVKHHNLVKLLGCCFEGDHRILVLEFLENNSLQQALLGPPNSRLVIDWPTRFNICVEIAKGIAYLHEESRPKIIHRDIKASNILLDKKLHPKIADFGLAKLFADGQSHISTRVAGTVGYLSPEYAMWGQLTEKVDVYAFGVLALEIISGRSNKAYLLEWVLQLNKEKALFQVIDPNLRDQYSEEEAMTIIEAAILCTHSSPNKRPTMSKVVAMLTRSSIKKRFETLVSHKKEDITT